MFGIDANSAKPRLLGSVRAKLITLSMVLALQCVAILLPQSAAACSFLNVEAAVASAALEANVYLAVSVFLLVVLLAMDIYARKISVPLIIVAVLVAIHPAISLPSTYDPSCTFINVAESQLVFAVIVLLTGYRAVRSASFFKIRVR